MMIYAAYILTASLVVLLSKKASDYIDLIEKTTKLSGAFLGGILLSAVTSLPELFTSISAVVLIGKPGLCMGNILGSDIFNLAMLAFLIPFYIKGFSKARLSEGHNYILYFLIVIYAVMGLNMFGVVRFAIFGINITTLLILALYAASVRFLAAENGEQQAPDEEVTNLSTRQITARFIAASIGIVLLSIAMTYITDEIAARLNLGAGLAGAIFLGVATSLPEVSSTIALFRIKSYNIAVGEHRRQQHIQPAGTVHRRPDKFRPRSVRLLRPESGQSARVRRRGHSNLHPDSEKPELGSQKSHAV
ncbi:MAG: hypothetical protein L6V35_07480 [Alistipes putredinis]|nr:MAG: hypothetical protein L6V35_07480 [Alistipes putredinis]